MKSWLLSLVSILLFVSGQASAGHRHGNNAFYYDYGRVIKVRPVFHELSQLQSGQQCFQHSNHSHRRSIHSHNKVLPTVAGAIVGGAVGNSLGNKRNRGVTTAAGAVIGGIVGQQLAHNSNIRHGRRQTSHATYCVDSRGLGFQKNHKRTRHNGRKRIRGYMVTYRYQGEKFTTFTRHHPGARIELEVSVRPTRFR